jgi:hypothetical protein
MRKILIATVISLSTLLLSQPVKADSDVFYKSVYKSIATSGLSSYNTKENREYVLNWLKQDKGYPQRVAISYCQDRRSRLSDSQIIRKRSGQLVDRQLKEGWSESRLNAFTIIEVHGISAGIQYYCPEFTPSIDDVLERTRRVLNR